MSTFPDSYEVPQKSGNYMKFQDGANRFRILSDALLGYEWWEDKQDGSRKPVRVDMTTKIDVSTVPNPDEVKHFMAFVVWNYNEEKIQILEITQKGIQKSLRALDKDEDWGNLTGYDIVVTKTGQKLDTEYSLQPKPAKKLDEGILAMYQGMNIDLTQLYVGGDPFQANGEKIAEDAAKDLA